MITEYSIDCQTIFDGKCRAADHIDCVKFERPVNGEAFSSRLRQILEAARMTQTEAARVIGMRQSSFSYYLAGNTPKPSMLQWMANRFKVRWQWLAYGDGPREPDAAAASQSDAFLGADEEERELVERLRIVLNFGTVEEKQMVGRMLDAAAGAVEARMGGGTGEKVGAKGGG